MTNRAPAEHWNRHHARGTWKIASKSDYIRVWIERHIPPAEPGRNRAIEIGCCPGRFLAVLGELGYELSGVDFAESIHLMPDWLRSQGYATGGFWQQDFLQLDTRNKFDVVMSLGFIEHFTNWQEVLVKHCEIVADAGYLVLEAPNFVGGFQHWLHSTLDRASFERHNTAAMDVNAWADVVQRRGFEILFHGYFGRFDFWVEDQPRTARERATLGVLHKLRRPLRALLPANVKAYSPVGGLIAKRVL